MHSIEVKGSPEIPGEGKPRRYAKLGNKPLIGAPEGINSLYDNFVRGVKLGGDDPFLGIRKMTNGQAGAYEWLSYNQVYTRVKNFGAGLIHLGLKPQDSLGLYSVNRIEWTIGEQAAYMHNFVTVPLYDTLGEEAVEFIVDQTNVQIVCLTKDKALGLLNMRDQVPKITHLLVMDSIDDALITLAEEKNVKLYLCSEVEKLGAEHPAEPTEPSTLDSVATICYTSGTTGLPKGVVLTHLNILSEANAFHYLVDSKNFYRLSKNDCHLSYLPLAHIFERIVFQFMIAYGARVGYYQGNTLKLMEDLAELKPTIFSSVPRLFNRVYDKVWSTVNAKGGLSAYLFRQAVRSKQSGLAHGSTDHWLWDRLVFKKLQQSLGGNVKIIVSGSAPLSSEVMDFLRMAFNANVHEGYGQTETTGCLTLTAHGETSSGHVGYPYPCAEVKLIDVPEMNYTSKDKPFPRGEICARGHSVFKQYYKDQKKTDEAITSDGWVRTGDVGRWDAQGRLIIIDRVKNIFKLAQGEYVAPERVENIYQTHPLVTQVFVHGHSLESCTVGVLVPDHDFLLDLMKEHRLDASDDRSKDAIYTDADVRQMVVRELNAFAKKHDAKGFECIKNVYLEADAFSPENGLLSPTFKLKRNVAATHYAAQIDTMYQELAKN
ncbi:hypothetical protein BJ085DRAFT_22103 [Dimargaris cristalligena]|uniref:Long-chain-fatty-acid--CoA ligase n=1 Tax=Dimargaris cristalligena TaxID=215637 RepID=A0A4P9ZYA3_9FUNG|nr:hypothetical protein BJ085DRAFT_22103 [Dimargaris cristalligena]|eukprot:RKP38348.1 hypothetical protein BJ085DRAFT_22103 [Dimargaris cristalligena]